VGERFCERATVDDSRCIKSLVCRDDDTDAERLGEDEHIAHMSLRVGERLVARCEFADDYLAIHWLRAVDCVATCDDPATVSGSGCPSGKHVAEELEGETVSRPGCHVERKEWFGTHGVYIADGIRCGDRPEREGVVDNGRKEINRCHEGASVRAAPHCGVVSGLDPNPKVGVHARFKWRQHLRQLGGAELAGSTGAVAEGGKPHGVVHRE
jgi:hypothetical protein